MQIDTIVGSIAVLAVVSVVAYSALRSKKK